MSKRYTMPDTTHDLMVKLLTAFHELAKVDGFTAGRLEKMDFDALTDLLEIEEVEPGDWRTVAKDVTPAQIEARADEICHSSLHAMNHCNRDLDETEAKEAAAVEPTIKRRATHDGWPLPEVRQ